MKTIITIATIFLISNCFYAKENNSNKSKSKQTITFDDYIECYGLNDTSIAIIEIYFDHQKRFGAGLISFLPVTATISIVNLPIGVVLMALTSPMVAKGLVSYGKFSDKNLLHALEDYQCKDFIADHLKNKLKNYFNKKEMIEKEIKEEEHLFSLKSIYNTVE